MISAIEPWRRVLLQLEVKDFDLAIDETGYRRFIAESTLVEEFWRSQPISYRGFEALDQFWRRVDNIFKNAAQRVHIEFFETTPEADRVKDFLWILNQGEVPYERLFEANVPVFGLVHWHSKPKTVFGEELQEIFLVVAIDVSSETGRRYFDRLLLLIKTTTKGSRLIINLDLKISSYFQKKDGGLRDLSQLSHFPCTSISMQTNLFSSS